MDKKKIDLLEVLIDRSEKFIMDLTEFQKGMNLSASGTAHNSDKLKKIINNNKDIHGRLSSVHKHLMHIHISSDSPPNIGGVDMGKTNERFAADLVKKQKEQLDNLSDCCTEVLDLVKNIGINIKKDGELSENELCEIKRSVGNIKAELSDKADKTDEENKKIISKLKEQMDAKESENIKVTNNFIGLKEKNTNLKEEKRQLEVQQQEIYLELQEIKADIKEEENRESNMFKHLTKNDEYSGIIDYLIKKRVPQTNQLLYTLEAYQAFKSTCKGKKNIHDPEREAAILQTLSQSLITLSNEKNINAKQFDEIIAMINSDSVWLNMISPYKNDMFRSKIHDSISGEIQEGSDIVIDDYKTLILEGRAKTEDPLIIKALMR